MTKSGHDTRTVYGPFYRKVNASTQDADALVKQVLSGELWGRPAQGAYEAKAKGHRGPLPDGEEGFEFWAFQPPDNAHGARVFWRQPGAFLDIDDSLDLVKLKIAFVKLTQSLHTLAP